MQKKCCSTKTIILFVVLISAALLTTLFTFHLKYKPVPVTLSDNAGTLFPVPREIKSFELMQSNQSTFTQDNFRNHWTLLFFGFTHCSSICPTTLALLSGAYRDLHPAYPNLQVVLISLDPERDTPTTLAQYTKSFHQDFIGATGKLQELRKLQSQFGIFSAREMTSSDNNYQLQHTASIMLINPRGEWTGLFNFGLTPAQFEKAFREGT